MDNPADSRTESYLDNAWMHRSNPPSSLVLVEQSHGLDRSDALVEKVESLHVVQSGTHRDSLVGFITARLYYTPNQLFSSDFTFNALDLFVLLTIEMHLMIMNAAYPNLLAFLSKTSTGFMNTAQTGTTSGSHNANGRSESSRHHVKLRNDATSHATVVANRAQDATSVKSFNSQQIMISKSVMVRDDAGEGDRNESSSYRGTKD
ncbi:hypothetical protein LTR12_009252 [Friedmanniomyces endolithicus]|nr:hypothetical protein LTR12_009252 [Friedmanniomyces endolithicus]